MAGRTSKRTAHQWADILVTQRGMAVHAKKLADKYGQSYLDDWIGVHMAEARWAARLLRDRQFTCLDTETTSTDRVAEMTEIAIIDGLGMPVCDTLVRPQGKLKETARLLTGITGADLSKAPRLKDVRAEIQAALLHRSVLLIYNAEFDLRVLNQSTFHVGLPEFQLPAKVEDLMLHFSRFVGDWNPRQDDYAWHRLEGGHRAVGDCRAMIALLEKMCRMNPTPGWSPENV